jgi:hypothetical protein
MVKKGFQIKESEMNDWTLLIIVLVVLAAGEIASKIRFDRILHEHKGVKK